MPFNVIRLCIASALAVATTLQASAQGVPGQQPRPTVSLYGTPGLIDMPTAYAFQDGDFSVTIGQFGNNTRATLSFQLLPRVNGVFRYSRIGEFDNGGVDPRFDRSFDISYQILSETRNRPALTLGVRDFGGTENFGAEYLVASKTLPGRVQATLGLGWGRLATEGGFTNPLGILAEEFERRPDREIGIEVTGDFRFDKLFRGDAAVFGGISWQATERWSLLAEISSDAYEREVEQGSLTRNSSYNFGANYRIDNALNLGLYYVYGSEVGFRITSTLNPKEPPVPGGLDPAPTPVFARPDRATAPEAWSTSWTTTPGAPDQVGANVLQALVDEGLTLEAISVSSDTAFVSIRNGAYLQSSQALGRAARALTRALPASIETFEITLVVQGMATTTTRLARSDLEDLVDAPDGAWLMYVRAQIEDAADVVPPPRSIASPPLNASIGLYNNVTLFDASSPFLFDVGLEMAARYEPRPGLVAEVSLQQPLVDNRSGNDNESNSVLPFVRSEQDNYYLTNALRLRQLTLARYWRPGENLYGRITGGYLEQAYAGISGELLWKQPGTRLAMGVEVSAVHQREPGSLFGLGTGDFDNQTVTGHVSGYYALTPDFEFQVDVGRYLAEDWGTTLTLTRVFDNGWRVGAYATFTDVSFDDFGEGSFDKGVFFDIPTAWIFGRPSKEVTSRTIQPLLRDGGAKLWMPGRLYEQVAPDSDPALRESWGRFWK